MNSGISINGGHYDQIERLRKNGLDYERIDEIKTMTGKFSVFVEVVNMFVQVTYIIQGPPWMGGWRGYTPLLYVSLTKGQII